MIDYSLEKLVFNYSIRAFPLRRMEKTPLISEWQKNASADMDTLRRWEGEFSPTGWGLVADSLIIVDVDSKEHGKGKKNGVAEWEELIANNPIPATFTVKTPTGGLHYYFSKPETESTFTKGADKLATGIDIQTNQAYVVAPGTRVQKGTYQVLSDSLVAPLPSWIEEKIKDRYVAPKYTDQPRPPIFNRDVIRAIMFNLNRLDRLSTRGWNGEPWDQTTFNCACSLIEIANNPYNDYPLNIAHNDFLHHCPSDLQFGADRHEEKWQSALKFIDGRSRSFDLAGEIEFEPDSPEARWEKLQNPESFVNTEDLEESLELYTLRLKDLKVPADEIERLKGKLTAILPKIDSEERALNWLSTARALIDKKASRYEDRRSARS